MGVSEDLKLTAQLRKAILPLVKILKAEANTEAERRLQNIESNLDKLLKNGIEVKVNVPDVKVEAPVIKFDKVIEAIKDQPLLKSDTQSSGTFEPHDQVKQTGVQFAGFVRSDGAWYIQRVMKGEQRYAKGSGDYAEAWEKKSKLKYGYIDQK